MPDMSSAEEADRYLKKLKSILEYINVLLMKLSKQNIKYINCVQIVEETKRRIKANSNYDMCIDYMIFSMWQEMIEHR